MGLVMRKILVFFLLLVSVSFSSDFDKKFNYFKGHFLKMQPDAIVEFLCLYSDKNSPFHKFFNSEGFRNLNYTCKKGVFQSRLNPYQHVDITNYKKLNKFVDGTKTDLKRMLCKDPAFKAALHFNIKFELKIYDSRDSLQETLTFNRNVTPACGLIR
jgi:hypothetical protein